MQFIENLGLGFAVAFQPLNLVYCFIGVLLGTMVGVLPGVGPLAAIAMLLPLTYSLDPIASLVMLAGIYYGSQYGGSTTAILINLPGESSSAVTTIEGYQMAKKGRAGPALAAAAIGSFVAGTIGTLIVAIAAQPLAAVSLRFGSAEYFSLMVIGLICAVALSSGSLVKALSMVILGLLLSMTGTDIYTGAERFTFGQLNLQDGVPFVVIAVGVYGVGEILRNLETSGGNDSAIAKVVSLWPSKDDLRRMSAPILRGTAVGSILGVLPGGGALLSSFLSYNIEKNISPNAAEFGAGAIEGVAAPEAANNASVQTAFIPTLALGIPGSATMAMMVGAMIMQGITPGPQVISRNPDLFWGLVASMWIGNAMLVILNLPLIGLWVAMLRIPFRLLFPAVITFCCIGVFSVNNHAFDVYLMIVAALIGYVFIKLDCEPSPFVLGFILGPLLEEHFRRALLISGGDASVFVTSPISASLLAIAVLILIVVSRPSVARGRKQVFIADET